MFLTLFKKGKQVKDPVCGMSVLKEGRPPYLTMVEGLAALTFEKDVSKLSCCAS